MICVAGCIMAIFDDKYMIAVTVAMFSLPLSIYGISKGRKN
jgi:hypothetical protein